MPLCTAQGVQTLSAIRYNSSVSDGVGGAVAAWEDHRGAYDIYAQRMNAAGAAQWTANGVPVCSGSIARAPQVASDDSGGVIVIWSDARNGSSYDLYAQRVNEAGVPQWTPNGVALDTNIRVGSTRIVSDGTGGAIVIWNDNRSDVTNSNIHAQRVNAAGSAQWAPNGVALCTAALDQNVAGIVSDGAGGAITTWFDLRNGTNYNIYAQRVNAAGVPQWAANGTALCASGGDQMVASIASDGAGGAIATWHDPRPSTSNYNIYAQRVDALGVAKWTANGVALCTATNNQFEPVIVSDGANGAIITWSDLRGGLRYDIYAQRLNATGVPQWAANGVALCSAADNQLYPRIVSDGASGAIVTWEDDRARNEVVAESQSDIYAQRVDAAGAPVWTPNGVALCTAELRQSFPGIVSDQAGGAFVTWDDPRSGTSLDLYAQHVNSGGLFLAVPPGASLPPPAARAWPNPFTEHVQIGFSLSAPTPVRMEVFDVSGRRVRAAPTALLDPGPHTLEWDGRKDDGLRAADGIYYLSVQGWGVVLSRTVIRLR